MFSGNDGREKTTGAENDSELYAFVESGEKKSASDIARKAYEIGCSGSDSKTVSSDQRVIRADAISLDLYKRQRRLSNKSEDSQIILSELQKIRPGANLYSEEEICQSLDNSFDQRYDFFLRISQSAKTGGGASWEELNVCELEYLGIIYERQVVLDGIGEIVDVVVRTGDGPENTYVMPFKRTLRERFREIRSGGYPCVLPVSEKDKKKITARKALKELSEEGVQLAVPTDEMFKILLEKWSKEFPAKPVPVIRTKDFFHYLKYRQQIAGMIR
jgi:hypothetical protein